MEVGIHQNNMNPNRYNPMYKIEQVSSNNLFYFLIVAKHGHIILKSEVFNSLDAVKKGIKVVQRNAMNMSRYERKTTSEGKFYFNLKSVSGDVLGKSQMYSSEAGMENGILAVKLNANSNEVQLPA